ncbi:MAG: hypothetical protein WD602_10375 [Actinomycetota bacterium]
MRILLDESTPRGLRAFFPGDVVETVPEKGWASVKNGELLSLAVENGYDVFITPDQALDSQQNLASYDVAVVVLPLARNTMPSYESRRESLAAIVQAAPRGEASWFTA